VIEQEESYTSKASSLDVDFLPVWNADNPQIKAGLSTQIAMAH
jgi:hypothetical protein